MKQGWEIKTLGDIGKVSMCKRILKEQTSMSGDIPFYKIGTFGKEPDAFISNEIYEEFRRKFSFPKNGDILISASGTIGRRVRYDGKPAYFQDSNIVWLDNDEKQVLNDYLYRFYEICDWKSTKGATISRLYNDNLRQIEIGFPKSLSEQQHIVAILDEAFTAIAKAKENAEQNLQNAKELFESYLQGVFENKGEGWEEKKLGDACDLIMGQSPAGETYNTDGIGVPLINGPVEFGKEPFSETIKSKFTTEPTKFCKRGDLILCVRGSTTGRINLAGFDACIGRGVAAIRYAKNQYWLNYFILSSRKKIYDLGTGATFPNVSGEMLKNLIIPIPPLKTQQTIVQKLDALNAETKKLEAIYQQKLNDLEELKKSVLQKAFAGELKTEKELVV